VLSVKTLEPQLTGQAKERLSSSATADFVQRVARDSFVIWLNQHPEAGEQLAALIISIRLREDPIVKRQTPQFCE
jgi:topoisomerase-4 subunit B